MSDTNDLVLNESSTDTNSDTSTTVTNANDTNFDIGLDKRTRVDITVDDKQSIDINYGPAFSIEYTALKLYLGDCAVRADRLFRAVESFIDIEMHGSTFKYDIDATDNNVLDLDKDSTLNLKLIKEAKFIGSINKNNLDNFGKVAVSVSNDSTWELTNDTYIDKLTIDDSYKDNINLNGYNLYISEKKWEQHPPVSVHNTDTAYDSTGAAKKKTLIVCTSKELPKISDRLRSRLYFCYDKMQLYFYQSLYTDPFCIVETMPKNPVENMIYICLDTGKVNTYYGYKIIEIGGLAENDKEGLETLKQSGTTYFMNAESRYLDIQTRTIQLPFQNGKYILSLDLGADLQINEETVIKFNPNTNQFYIAGTNYHHDNRLDAAGVYTGYLTDTVQTQVSSNILRADVMLSDSPKNGIEIAETGGLFVNTADLASEADYEVAMKSFAAYKKLLNGYVDELASAVTKVTSRVSEDTINAKIIKALKEYEPFVDEMIDKYDEFYKRLLVVESEVGTVLDDKIDEAKKQITDYVDEKVETTWTYFPEDNRDKPVLTNDEVLIKINLLNWYRTYIKDQRNIDYKEIIIVDDVDSLPEVGSKDKLYFVYNSTDRTYTAYTWNTTSNSYDKGATTDKYSIVEDENPEDETECYMQITKINNYNPYEDKDTEKTNSFGLYEDEQNIQDLLTTEFEDKLKAENRRHIYISKYLFPNYGDAEDLYYVINIDKNIFRIYQWEYGEYDQETYEIIKPSGYKLVYDEWPESVDADPRKVSVATYEDIIKAINNENENNYGSVEIDLTKDITINSGETIDIPESMDVTIVMNGFNIVSSDPNIFNINGSLDIINEIKSTEIKETSEDEETDVTNENDKEEETKLPVGVITSTSIEDKYIVEINENGSLNLSVPIIINTSNSKVNGIHVNGGRLTVSDNGSIKVNLGIAIVEDGNNSGVSVYYGNEDEEIEISSKSKDAVYVYGYSNYFSANSGTITGICAKQGNIYISGTANVVSTVKSIDSIKDYDSNEFGYYGEGITLLAGISDPYENPNSKYYPKTDEDKEEKISGPITVNISGDATVSSDQAEAIGIYRIDTRSSQSVDVSISESEKLTSATNKDKYKVYEHDSLMKTIGDTYDPQFESSVSVTIGGGRVY